MNKQTFKTIERRAIAHQLNLLEIELKQVEDEYVLAKPGTKGVLHGRQEGLKKGINAFRFLLQS